MKFPENGRIYSINEGNLSICQQGVQNYVKYCQESDPATQRPYSGRYIGSLVADFHRNLLKGGVYVYPSTDTSPNGKLRLLYECNPLAFVIEQAGGKVTDFKGGNDYIFGEEIVVGSAAIQPMLLDMIEKIMKEE